MKITNVKFINKETGEIVLVLKEAEIGGFPLFYFKQGKGDINSGSCAENRRPPLTFKEYIQAMDDYIAELKELKETNPALAKQKALKSLMATGMWDEDGHFMGVEQLNKQGQG